MKEINPKEIDLDRREWRVKSAPKERRQPVFLPGGAGFVIKVAAAFCFVLVVKLWSIGYWSQP